MKKSIVQFILNDGKKLADWVDANKRYKGKTLLCRLPARIKLESALETLRDKAYTKVGELSCTAYVTKEPVPFDKKFGGTKKTLKVGDKWAEEIFDCAWMHVKGTVPHGIDPSEVVFLVDTSGEGLIFDINGTPKQGITCYASQYDYRLGLPVKKVVINDGLTFGSDVEFFIDSGANDLFGNMKNGSAIQQMDIALPNKNIRALAYDLEMLLAAYDFGAASDYTEKLYSVIRAVEADCREIDEAKADKLRQILKPYLDTKNDLGDVMEYSAIGHAHTDLAWLWPLRETKRKGARTFSNQLLNISRYDGYKFGASQAQLYAWIKESYPSIYEGVKEAYKNGRWEAQGATWVEMDSNLISGESLVRQFYYGQKFYEKEFGERMKILWLPDSFGYSACLPQVMALADVPYFLTQKMSWNTVNKFPYHTFNWSGLDGTTVLAHMLPDDTYNGPANAERAKFGERNYRERKICNIAMSLYGIGDGGGGPGFEHIERAERMRDIKGLPKYKMEFAKDFFVKLDNDTARFPKYDGELYLEKHQGTYTTYADNKKYNRRCEFLLRDYESLMTLAALKGVKLPIEKEELEAIWKEVLLYQFHDIIPGSSIQRVYEETKPRYEAIISRLKSAIDTLTNSFVKGQGLVNFNSYSYRLPIKVNDIWYDAVLPPLGVCGISPKNAISRFEAKITDNTLENDKVKVTFKDGFIVSVFDKTANKEIVKSGKKFNLFTMYLDLGNNWDHCPKYHRIRKARVQCDSFATELDGATAIANVSYSIGGTKIMQQISILDGSAQLTFDTNIIHNAKRCGLRVEFPTSVNTEECSFNVQFGHLTRRTTDNNSIERAQYEVSGQKFVDMSSADYGVSLINNCKYGFRCKKGVMDMDLIRTPYLKPSNFPFTKKDKLIDQGNHHIKYTVLPHTGALSAQTYKEAYLLNNPITVVTNSIDAAENASYLAMDNVNVVLEAIKLADDGNGFVARFYNASASEQTAKPQFEGCKASCTVNVLEEKLADTDGTLKFRAFELKCVKYVLK